MLTLGKIEKDYKSRVSNVKAECLMCNVAEYHPGHRC